MADCNEEVGKWTKKKSFWCSGAQQQIVQTLPESPRYKTSPTFIKTNYLDDKMKEPWANMMDKHGVRKTINILTKVMLFYNVLKQRKPVSQL